MLTLRILWYAWLVRSVVCLFTSQLSLVVMGIARVSWPSEMVHLHVTVNSSINRSRHWVTEVWVENAQVNDLYDFTADWRERQSWITPRLTQVHTHGVVLHTRHTHTQTYALTNHQSPLIMIVLKTRFCFIRSRKQESGPTENSDCTSRITFNINIMHWPLWYWQCHPDMWHLHTTEWGEWEDATSSLAFIIIVVVVIVILLFYYYYYSVYSPTHTEI